VRSESGVTARLETSEASERGWRRAKRMRKAGGARGPRVMRNWTGSEESLLGGREKRSHGGRPSSSMSPHCAVKRE
jgi:hypothetical protein